MDLTLLHKTNLLFSIFPVLRTLQYVEQDPRWHSEGNTLIHTMLVCENIPKGDKILFFTALFHDLGKMTTTMHQEDG